MNRHDFLKSSAILGGTSLLPVNNVFSQSLKESGLDRLTDKEGNFNWDNVAERFNTALKIV